MPTLMDLRRTLAALVAVMLSAALITFAFILSDSYQTQVTATSRASLGGADVVVLPGRGQSLPADTADRLRQVAGAGQVRAYQEGAAVVDHPGRAYDKHTFVLAAEAPGTSEHLTAGRLPEGAAEVAVSTSLAEENDLRVGDSLSLFKNYHDPTSRPFQVVGIVQVTADLTRQTPEEPFVLAAPQGRAALGQNEHPQAIYLHAQPGTSASALAEAVTAATQDLNGAQVYTAEELVPLRARLITSGATTILTLMSLLGPVCALVSAIMIAATFSTLVAHQTRQIGLLRCVGASRRQVRLAVLRGALCTGLLGAALGAGAGTAAAWLLVRAGVAQGLASDCLTISWTSLALGVVLSLLVTVLAVVRPAGQASRVSPLVALTGKVAQDQALGRRRTWAAAAGLLVALIGAGALAVAVPGQLIQLAAAGAATMMLGLLLTMPLAVTAAARLVARLAGERRPLLQLAARNLGRNPGRAAATTAALLVSVTVAITMVTGLASVASSMDGYLASSNPLDLQVEVMQAGQDAQAVQAKVAAVPKVEATVLVAEPTVQLRRPDGTEEPLTMHAVDQEALAPVARSFHGLEGLDDHTLVLGGLYQLPEDSQVVLTGPAGSMTLQVKVVEGGYGPVVTPAVAHQLMGEEPMDQGLWVRLQDGGTDKETVAAVRESLHGSGLVVSANGDGQLAFIRQVNRTTVVIGLVLALTVLITLTGLANTTEVSVLERVREIGVLRATGCSRGQVRALFVTEAVLTALLGGLLGTLLGTGLGLAGVATLLGSEDSPDLVLTVPWLQLLGVLAVSALVGVAASVRPARRAASVAPVTALAAQ